MVLEICSRTDRQTDRPTDRQTDMLITILHSLYELNELNRKN